MWVEYSLFDMIFSIVAYSIKHGYGNLQASLRGNPCLQMHMVGWLNEIICVQDNIECKQADRLK